MGFAGYDQQKVYMTIERTFVHEFHLAIHFFSHHVAGITLLFILVAHFTVYVSLFSFK